MFVSSGSVLNWTGTFDSWSFDTLSLDDAMSQVSAYLKNNYNLVVTDYNDTLSSDIGAGDLVVTVQTGQDRGDTGTDDGVADIKGNVDDAFSHLNTYGATPPNLVSSQCQPNSITPSSGGGGPAYSFSIRNLLPSWLGGMPVTPEQQAQYTAAGQAQIQAVASNAKAAYGAGSDAAAAATTAANTNSNAFVKDESLLADKQNKAAASSDQWLLYGLIAAAVLVGVVVALPYIGAARTATRV